MNEMSPAEHAIAEGYFTTEGGLTTEGLHALANLEGPFALYWHDPETGERGAVEVIRPDAECA